MPLAFAEGSLVQIGALAMRKHSSCCRCSNCNRKWTVRHKLPPLEALNRAADRAFPFPLRTMWDGFRAAGLYASDADFDAVAQQRNQIDCRERYRTVRGIEQ